MFPKDRSLIIWQLRWCIFKLRQPLQILPQLHSNKAQGVHGDEVFADVSRVFSISSLLSLVVISSLLLVFTLFLHIQACRPNDLKSVPQKEQTTKTIRNDISELRNMALIDTVMSCSHRSIKAAEINTYCKRNATYIEQL